MAHLNITGRESLGRVLVVDDDPSTRSVVKSMIAKLPLDLMEASDGQTALEMIMTQPIDIIVSDLIMPKMSGLMLLHILIEKGIQVPFILLTGFSDKESAIQALRLGVFDYLEKPVHDEDLISVVEEALRVSHDQKMILAGQGLIGTESVHKVDPRAKSMILKMRAFGHQEMKTIPIKVDDVSWASLRDLFVEESTKLLTITKNQLADWLNKKQPLIDLGYILRVVQSIRFAASAVSIAQVADTAWQCEAAIAAIKISPDYVNRANIEVISDGIKLLYQHIDLLVQPEDLRTIKSLSQLQTRLGRAS